MSNDTLRDIKKILNSFVITLTEVKYEIRCLRDVLAKHERINTDNQVVERRIYQLEKLIVEKTKNNINVDVVPDDELPDVDVVPDVNVVPDDDVVPDDEAPKDMSVICCSEYTDSLSNFCYHCFDQHTNFLTDELKISFEKIIKLVNVNDSNEDNGRRIYTRCISKSAKTIRKLKNTLKKYR